MLQFKNVIVSLFEKDVGPLQNHFEMVNRNSESEVYIFEFLHKDKILVKILFIRSEPDHWVIHHECSKENPFLSKKIGNICERIKRLKEDKFTAFSLSDDLKEIQKEHFLLTALKSNIQNGLNYFTLFGQEKEQRPSQIKSVGIKTDR